MSAFEALMPLVGLAAGREAGPALGGAAEVVAGVLLIALGVYVLVEGEEEPRLGGASLVAVGLSVSLDELALGFTIGLVHLPLWPTVAAIAVQAFVVALVGLWIGGRAAHVERLAAAALVGLGVYVLLR